MVRWAFYGREKMKISKTSSGYHLMIAEYAIISFDGFEKNEVGVSLFKNGHYVAGLTFDRASDFYRAWRAMQCK